jgi:hypothetical protein
MDGPEASLGYGERLRTGGCAAENLSRASTALNFLLHHRLAQRDLISSASAIGAMLPDLWRMVDRRVRPARAVPETARARVAEVLRGIEHHTRADAAFHACQAFAAGEESMTRAFRAIDAPKLPLFAHVAWELCLDGALVRRERARLLVTIREGIEQASEREGTASALEVAAGVHHGARRGAALPTDFVPRIARFLDVIARGPWIDGYARGESLASRIDAIRRHLGLSPLLTTDLRALTTILETAVDGADDALDAVLALAL